MSTPPVGPCLPRRTSAPTHRTLTRNWGIQGTTWPVRKLTSPIHPHSPFPSAPQLSRTASERLPPTVHSSGRKSSLSATWTPFSSSGFCNEEGETPPWTPPSLPQPSWGLPVVNMAADRPGPLQKLLIGRGRIVAPPTTSPPGGARLGLRGACAARRRPGAGMADFSVCRPVVLTLRLAAPAARRLHRRC